MSPDHKIFSPKKFLSLQFVLVVFLKSVTEDILLRLARIIGPESSGILPILRLKPRMFPVNDTGQLACADKDVCSVKVGMSKECLVFSLIEDGKRAFTTAFLHIFREVVEEIRVGVERSASRLLEAVIVGWSTKCIGNLIVSIVRNAAKLGDASPQLPPQFPSLLMCHPIENLAQPVADCTGHEKESAFSILHGKVDKSWRRDACFLLNQKQCIFSHSP